jgi:hypothetical protein
VITTDPRIIRWLSVEGDISYHCQTCNADRAVRAIGGDATPEPVTSGGQPTKSASIRLTDELERLASLRVSGALTDAEFQAAKARLLGI